MAAWAAPTAACRYAGPAGRSDRQALLAWDWRAKVARFLGVDAFVVGLEQEHRDDRGYGDSAYGTEAIFVPHAQVGPEPH